MRYLLLLLLVAGCSKGKSPIFSETDSEFSSYVSQFDADFCENSDHCVSAKSIPINFYPMDIRRHGSCEDYGKKGREIFINKDRWDMYTASTRRALIYHELGHCLLGRIHDETISSRGNPNSIMYPDIEAVIFTPNAYKPKYIRELFTGDNSVWSN